MSKLAVLGGKPVRRRPYPSWPQGGPEEMDWVRKVLQGNRWFAGPSGDDPEALGTVFGKRFAELHGAEFGLPVSNGSVAIEIALRALGVSPGDEVIVPAYTFVSTATSVLMVGGVPVFSDIDPHSYCLDPKDVENRIGPNTRAVIPVHLGGHMADMKSLVKTARDHDMAVIEDAAQAIDAALGGKKAGTWGELGTFSFQSNKTMTSGEGGLVMTNDLDLAERVAALRAFGRPKGASADRSSELGARYLSSNYRLSEFQAAVLLSQMEKFPSQDKQRQANALRLTEALKEIPGIKHIRADSPSMKHGYYYYLIRFDPEHFGGLDPDTLCKVLHAEGIPFVAGDRKPIYRHPVFQSGNLAGSICPSVLERYRESVDLDHPACPAAEAACKCTLILRHQVLLAQDKDMDDIVEALIKVQKNINDLL